MIKDGYHFHKPTGDIRGVINKFVDKCYKLTTIEGKTKYTNYINTGSFSNLHPAVRQLMRFQVGRGCKSATRQRRQL